MSQRDLHSTELSSGSLGINYCEIELEQRGSLAIYNTPSTLVSNVLITISNMHSVETYLVTPQQIVRSDAKYFVDAPPERVQDGVTKRRRDLAKIVTVFGYALTIFMLTFAGLSATGYIKARIVLTGSMEPAISPGDIIISANPQRIPADIGEVITYQARRFDGSPVGIFSHRIIGGSQENGWLVKGDNNPAPDVQKPQGSDVLGVLIFTIPFIGKILSRQFLFTVIPIIIGIWFLLDVLRANSRD